MKSRCGFMVAFMLLMATTACGNKQGDITDIVTDVNAKAQKTANEWTNWGLRQCGKLSDEAAVTIAQKLKIAAISGADWLESDTAEKTAEKVNQYLVDCILKNLNPGVAAGIDIAARVLDDVLGVPVGTTLTKAQMQLVASFTRGIADGCDAFLAGREANPPKMFKAGKTPAQRFWFKAPKPAQAQIDLVIERVAFVQ